MAFADHQTKPDIATVRAREWFDKEGVAAIADVAASGTALAVVDVARTRNRPVLISAAARRFEPAYQPGLQPDLSTAIAPRMLANVIVDAVTGGGGGDSWWRVASSDAG